MRADADRCSYSRKPGFTAMRLRPLARRREITERPLLVFIRVRNPCVFERRRRLGWNVRFGMRNCAPHWENSHWDKLKVYRLTTLPSKLRTWLGRTTAEWTQGKAANILGLSYGVCCRKIDP